MLRRKAKQKFHSMPRESFLISQTQLGYFRLAAMYHINKWRSEQHAQKIKNACHEVSSTSTLQVWRYSGTFELNNFTDCASSVNAATADRTCSQAKVQRSLCVIVEIDHNMNS